MPYHKRNFMLLRDVMMDSIELDMLLRRCVLIFGALLIRTEIGRGDGALELFSCSTDFLNGEIYYVYAAAL
jgi:hypothetical protein